MARIKDSSVEAVKSAAEILPLVEDYVRLRKAAGRHQAAGVRADAPHENRSAAVHYGVDRVA